MGLRHAVEADHVAAVSSLSIGAGRGRRMVRLGTFWGLGHAASLFAVGALFVSFDWGAPERFSGWVELGVGMLLIWLGGDLIWRLIRERIHFHVHAHNDGTRHFHAHAHREKEGPHDAARHAHAHARRMSLRALMIGVIHGMAGSAALVVLALGAVQSVWQGLSYMALFGAGSVAGMAILSAAISVPIGLSARSLTRTFRVLQGGVGVWTAGLGAAIIFDSLQLVTS